MLRAVFLFSFVLSTFTLASGQVPKTAAEGFEASDMRGATVSLEGLRGKVVVLNFWSTHCVICHSEIPKLNQMVKGYKGKGVVFLAVTVENPNKVETYLKETPFDFGIIPNGFGVLLKYATKSPDGTINMPYPTFFVISPEGSVELKTDGAGRIGQMSGVIDRLLASPVKSSAR